MFIYAVPVLVICLVATILFVWNEIRDKKAIKRVTIAVAIAAMCLGIANQMVFAKVDNKGYEDEVTQGTYITQEEA